MPSKQLFDTPLKTIAVKTKKGDFGIEVELEGSLKSVTSIFGDGGSKYWKSKVENSLRNGMEYVCKQPVAEKSLDLALEEYDKIVTASKPKLSIRCSTHIHCNVLNLTPLEIFRVLGYYYLIEDLLVRTQGPLRMGNLFCLRLSDAEGIADDLRHKISGMKETPGDLCFNHLTHNVYKYGAVNLNAVSKFGSLEFRFLRPITDSATLKFWCLLFKRLIDEAANLPLEKTLEMVQDASVSKFLGAVFTQEQIAFIMQTVTPSEASEMVMWNYDHVFELAETLRKPQRVTVGLGMIPNDLQVPPSNPMSMDTAILDNGWADEEFDEEIIGDGSIPTIELDDIPDTPW